MGPSHFFEASFVNQSSHLAFKKWVGEAACAGTTLIVDGLVYEVLRQKVIPPALDQKKRAEILLELYLERPADFFERIKGQCTISIISPNKILSFRSHLCPQQIYYSRKGISNRLLPLYHSLGKPDPNLLYFFDFVMEQTSLHYDSPLTPFEGIKRLLPGELLTHKRVELVVKEIVPKKDYAYLDNPQQGSQEVTEKITSLIHQAIDDRLPSDSQKVVSHLSGGLDSSFVTALLASRGTKVSSFMYSFPDRPSHAFSENCAQKVASSLGIDLKIISPQEIPGIDLRNSLPYCDEPSDSFWQGAVFAPVTDHLVPKDSVLFTGFGADQIFLRDPRVMPWLLRRGKIKDLFKTLSDTAQNLERSRMHLLYQTLLCALPGGWHRKLNRVGRKLRYNPFALEEMEPDAVLLEPVPWLEFSSELTERMEDELSQNEKNIKAGSPLEFSYLVSPYFSSDPFFEGRGAYSTHPYCDSRLIDYVLGEVSWQHIHDWRKPYKNLLREAQRGTVPEEVRTRDKNEFYFDGFLAKLLKDNQNYLRSLIREKSLPVPIALSEQKAHRALDELLFGIISNSSSKVLTLASYLLWWRDFQAQTMEAS